MAQALTNNLLPVQSNIHRSNHETLILRKELTVLSRLKLTVLNRLHGQYEDLSKIASEFIKYMMIIVPVVSEHTWANA